MADEPEQAEVIATLAITAELVGPMWTLYAPNGNSRVAIGSGSKGTGIMLPVSAIERYVEQS